MMKKIFAIFSLIFSIVALSSCSKQERYTFFDTTYYLKEKVSFDESMTLENVVLNFDEITKNEYEEAKSINVITSRYNNKYYNNSLSMIIDGINYDNISTTERLG